MECYFNYCCLIWHFCSNANSYKLEKLQKRALKFITLDFKSSYAQLLNKCNKRPLYTVRIYKFLEMVYTIVNHTCPSYLNNLFTLKNTSFSFRCENNGSIPRYDSITYGKRSCHYMAPFHWNTLPNTYKEHNTLIGFKKVLSNWTPKCNCGFCVQFYIFNM